MFTGIIEISNLHKKRFNTAQFQNIVFICVSKIFMKIGDVIKTHMSQNGLKPKTKGLITLRLYNLFVID